MLSFCNEIKEKDYIFIGTFQNSKNILINENNRSIERIKTPFP